MKSSKQSKSSSFEELLEIVASPKASRTKKIWAKNKFDTKIKSGDVEFTNKFVEHILKNPTSTVVDIHAAFQLLYGTAFPLSGKEVNMTAREVLALLQQASTSKDPNLDTPYIRKFLTNPMVAEKLKSPEFITVMKFCDLGKAVSSRPAAEVKPLSLDEYAKRSVVDLPASVASQQTEDKDATKDVLFGRALALLEEHLEQEQATGCVSIDQQIQLYNLLYDAMTLGSEKARWLYAICLANKNIDLQNALDLIFESAQNGDINAMRDCSQMLTMLEEHKEPENFFDHAIWLLMNNSTCRRVVKENKVKFVKFEESFALATSGQSIIIKGKFTQHVKSKTIDEDKKIADALYLKVYAGMEQLSESGGLDLKSLRSCYLGVYIKDARLINLYARYLLLFDKRQSPRALDLIEIAASMRERNSIQLLSELHSAYTRMLKGAEDGEQFIANIPGTVNKQFVMTLLGHAKVLPFLALKNNPLDHALKKIVKQFEQVTVEERNIATRLLDLAMASNVSPKSNWLFVACLIGDNIRAMRLLIRSAEKNDVNSMYTLWLIQHPDCIASEPDTIHKQIALRLLESSLVPGMVMIGRELVKPAIDQLEFYGIPGTTQLAHPPKTTLDGEAEFERAKKCFLDNEPLELVQNTAEIAISRGSKGAQWFFAVHIVKYKDSPRAFDLVESAFKKGHERSLVFFKKLVETAKQYFAITDEVERAKFLQKADREVESEKMLYSFLGNKSILEVIKNKYLDYKLEVKVQGSENPLYQFLRPQLPSLMAERKGPQETIVHIDQIPASEAALAQIDSEVKSVLGEVVEKVVVANTRLESKRSEVNKRDRLFARHNAEQKRKDEYRKANEAFVKSHIENLKAEIKASPSDDLIGLRNMIVYVYEKKPFEPLCVTKEMKASGLDINKDSKDFWNMFCNALIQGRGKDFLDILNFTGVFERLFSPLLSVEDRVQLDEASQLKLEKNNMDFFMSVIAGLDSTFAVRPLQFTFDEMVNFVCVRLVAKDLPVYKDPQETQEAIDHIITTHRLPIENTPDFMSKVNKYLKQKINFITSLQQQPDALEDIGVLKRMGMG